MIVRVLCNVKHGGVNHSPGAEIYVRDADAFPLIQSGGAEPATRGAKKRFAAMLKLDQEQRAAAEAVLAARPKELSMYTVFTPVIEFLGGHRGVTPSALKGGSHV